MYQRAGPVFLLLCFACGFVSVKYWCSRWTEPVMTMSCGHVHEHIVCVSGHNDVRGALLVAVTELQSFLCRCHANRLCKVISQMASD